VEIAVEIAAADMSRLILLKRKVKTDLRRLLRGKSLPSGGGRAK
jgi:hypothetical protein